MTVVRAARTRPTRAYGGYVFDLDGTLYLGDTLLPGAADTVAAIRARGARLAFVTNKPLERPGAYAAKLTHLGIPADPAEVVSSTDALIRYLHLHASGARVLTVAEPLVDELLVEAGFVVTRDSGAADLVVVSWDRTFDYDKLVRAFRAVRGGARLVATNPDPWCPMPDGALPDCAAMLAAVEASTGVTAEAVVGKPSAHMAETIIERLALAPADTLLVGDRLLTDVPMAAAVGMASALVLTGATAAEGLDVELASAPVRPGFVIDSVADLLPT